MLLLVSSSAPSPIKLLTIRVCAFAAGPPGCVMGADEEEEEKEDEEEDEVNADSEEGCRSVGEGEGAASES